MQTVGLQPVDKSDSQDAGDLRSSLADKTLEDSLRPDELREFKLMWSEIFGWTPTDLRAFRANHPANTTIGELIAQNVINKSIEKPLREPPKDNSSRSKKRRHRPSR